MPGPKRSLEEDIGFPGTGVTDSFEPPCQCWELNLSPVEGQSVLLIDEPLLQPLFLKRNKSGAGEVAHRLRALAALQGS